MALHLWRWWCPLVAGGALLLPLFGCVPSLCPSFVPFLLCLWCITLEYGFISRFKGVFRGFYGADVCLYGFGRFAWIVWLLCACIVRRLKGLWRVCLYFVLFCPLSCPLFCPLSCPFALVFAFLFTSLFLLSLFVLLSSACPLSLFVGCCFFFPYGICAKRKGAPCWCVLSCPVVVRWLLSHHYNFSGFYSVLHPCHIVNRNKVSIPSVSVVIEANKRKI